MKNKTIRTAVMLLLVTLLVCFTTLVVYKKVGKHFGNFVSNSIEQTQNSEVSGNKTVQAMTEQWTYAMQSAEGGKDEMDGVTVDTKGNVIMGGPFQYTVDFNGVKRTAQNGIDFYVSKLTPKGKELWFVTVDSGGDDFMWDLTSDTNDDILISGGYGGTLSINGKTYNAQKDGSALYAKIDGDTGAFVWVVTAGVVSDAVGLVDSERTAGGNEIKVDSKGNAVAILSAYGDEYQIGNRTYKKSGVMDSFIVKISPQGEFLWEYQFLGSGRKQGRAIGVNGKDEIAFGHQLIGEIDTKEGFDFTTATNKIAQGDAGLLTPDGKLKWMVPVISDGFANVRGAGGDASGNVYFTGVITESSKIGTTDVVGYKNGSTFLTKYSSEGVQQWVRVMGNDEQDDAGELIVFDESIAISSANAGEDYHLYDERGSVLMEDVFSVSSRKGRATLAMFDTSGNLVARYEPAYTDFSTVGVLEYAGDNCIMLEHAFYGKIAYGNGDTYTSVNNSNPKTPDKDIALAKLCLP